MLVGFFLFLLIIFECIGFTVGPEGGEKPAHSQYGNPGPPCQYGKE